MRRGALTLIVAAALYEVVARSGYFPPALTPTLGSIAHTLFASLLDGTMLFHAAATLYRVVIGFGCAIAIGLPLGVMMGRFRPVENFVLPLTSGSKISSARRERPMRTPAPIPAPAASVKPTISRISVSRA